MFSKTGKTFKPLKKAARPLKKHTGFFVQLLQELQLWQLLSSAKPLVPLGNFFFPGL